MGATTAGPTGSAPDPGSAGGEPPGGLPGTGSVEDPQRAQPLGAPSLEAACEAVLLLADEPIDLRTLAGVLRRPTDRVEVAIRALSAQYTADGRGFDLREVAGGWRFYTREDCAGVVGRYVIDGQQARLTQAALETLAIIAYRQPITRGRISAVRGVSVDGVVRTLLQRGLVSEVGIEPGTGAGQLGTTRYFLERLGIRGLADLPALAEHVPAYDQLGDLTDRP